jgi:molybdopterin converting factor small subunit
MAQITVRFYTTLREKIGKSKVSLDAPTVAQALEELKKQFGSRFTEQLYKVRYILIREEGSIPVSF